jgi:hypothetical protein
MIFTIDSSADFFCALMKSRLQRVQQLQPLGVQWLLKNAKNEAKHAISVDHVAMIGTFIPHDPRCTLSLLLHRGNAEAIPRHFTARQRLTKNDAHHSRISAAFSKGRRQGVPNGRS